jgi:predicted RNase H-like nuclease (RuvC/YqgF family)
MTAQELAVELRESSRIKIRMAAAEMLEGNFVSQRYDPKRCSDKVEALTEQLAFEKKRSEALLCTITRMESEVAQAASDNKHTLALHCAITRLEGEVAQAARANQQLVQTVMELRNAGDKPPQVGLD